MKPFNLEAAKAGAPLVTRDGRQARIICFDKSSAHDKFPIVALTKGSYGIDESINSYTVEGTYWDDGDNSPRDLFMVPEKKEAWVNVYPCGYVSKQYASEDIAKDNSSPSVVATVKIEWEV
jgi:hypothetical protein